MKRKPKTQPRRRRRWTTREDDLLRGRGMLRDEFAEWLGRSEAELLARSDDLGFPFDELPAWAAAAAPPPTPEESPDAGARDLELPPHAPAEDDRPQQPLPLREREEVQAVLPGGCPGEAEAEPGLAPLNDLSADEVLAIAAGTDGVRGGRSTEAMEAEAASIVARKVALHLYRGSIELARQTLEAAWTDHLADEAPLPVGAALLDEPLARVCPDVRLLNALETEGLLTVRHLLRSTPADWQAIPNLGGKHVATLTNLAAGLRQRAYPPAKISPETHPTPAAEAATMPRTDAPDSNTPDTDPPATKPPARPDGRRKRAAVPITDPTLRRWCEEETVRLLPLIEQLAIRSRLPFPLEDLVQEGAKAVFEALPKFDPNRGAKVETWLTLRIRGAFCDYARKHGRLTKGGARTGRKEHITSLDHVLATSDTDRDFTVGHILEDTKALDPQRCRGGEQWQNMLRGFDLRERLIVIEYFVHGRTMREVGRDLDLSESRVSQMASRILSRLKELDAIDGRVREACA